VTAEEPRPVVRRFAEGTTIEGLKAYMRPFVERLGFKLNTDTDFVDMVLASEIEILDRDGDVYCPCRVRTGDMRKDADIICPCIPYYLDDFWAMRKCWCGLFIREDVEDGSTLHGVIERPEGPVETRVAAADDLCDGQGRVIRVKGVQIAVFRVGPDEFYAIGNTCKHVGGSLGDGFLDGYEAMCPRHGWRFDVRTGATDHPGADVKTYPVAVRDGQVFLTL
jgi:nitrite reductase/ring-hydroxylating ferredoxin subunit